MVSLPERVTKMEIGVSGTDVDITGVKYYAWRLVGDGPGGDMVSPRTVPNTIQPITVRQHHKWWEIIVGVDERMYTALFATDVLTGASTDYAINDDADNSAIGFLVFTFILTDGSTTVTHTYLADKSYVAAYRGGIRDGENNQIEEIKFLCVGTRLIG